MVHDRSRQHRAAQSHPKMADQLERITPRFDALTHRARLGEQTGMSAAEYHELEEMAQGIARDILAPFRGRRAAPSNPPLYVSRDGTKAAW